MNASRLELQTHFNHRFHFWIFVLDVLKKLACKRRLPRFCLGESKVDVTNGFSDDWMRICWMPATHDSTPIYTYVRLTLECNTEANQTALPLFLVYI
jgi:hypothetical protein